jgi:hypothetical protein
MTVAEKIMALTKQLLPTGRAWWMPVGGNFEKLMTGLQASEARAYSDAVSILNSALPDNDEFTVDDATAWEKRLGLISNSLVPLADRKLAIARKMAHPGLIPARQNYLYLQGQLQAVGFNVYVYENRFPDYYAGYVTETLEEFSEPSLISLLEHGDFQHGDEQHGPTFLSKIANSIDWIIDDSFDLGSNLHSTFFISGSPAGVPADVPLIRREEFRELVLKIKPRQTVALLVINYTS